MSGPLAGHSLGLVGAGFGGLSAAAHLAADGADVTVDEKRDQVGGVAGVDLRDRIRTEHSACVSEFREWFKNHRAPPSDWHTRSGRPARCGRDTARQVSRGSTTSAAT